ncbi:Rab family GTPase [Pelomyxa schiedti]|nr:Rab family GTPase [Pelomyxa schiedti]
MYGERIKLQIWDTADERSRCYHSPTYFRAAHGILVVYAVTNQDSFDNIKLWEHEIERYGREDGNVLYVGTKTDLTAERVVTYEVASAALNRVEENKKPFGKRDYIEVSSKTGANVDLVFYRIAQTAWLREKALGEPPKGPATAPPANNCSVM